MASFFNYNLFCYCPYCSTVRGFMMNIGQNAFYNPLCRYTYTHDLRNHECLYPDRAVCCPIFFTTSGTNTLVVPRPLYALPRVQAEQRAAALGHVPGFSAFHYPETGRSFETRSCYIHPPSKPLASTIPQFNTFGRQSGL